MSKVNTFLKKKPVGFSDPVQYFRQDIFLHDSSQIVGRRPAVDGSLARGG